MVQKTLNNEEIEEKPILLFSKQIKGRTVNSRTIDDNKTRKEVLQLVKSLLKQGKSRKLDELTFKENCRMLIESILEEYPDINERDVKLLIFDFTDSMQTSMREEEKYAIAIIYDRGLLLVHSEFGEQTLTPEWRVVKRMLDRDNVIRYAYFYKENDSVEVRYHERVRGSESFINWLGLPEREAFYFLGGKYRIQTEIGDIYASLEFTEDEVEKILIDGSLETKDHQIILKQPVKVLPIKQITVGRKIYTNINDFVQDFYAKKYDIKYYSEKYFELMSSQIPYIHKIIDEKNKIIYFEGGEEKIYLRKRNPNFDIIFANERIDIRDSFLSEIVAKIINNQEIKIFHAGSRFSQTPIEIKTLKIFNSLNLSETTASIIRWFNETELRDSFLHNVIYSTILYSIYIENQKSPILNFLFKLINKLQEFITPNIKFTELESEFLEYKSRSIFEGKDQEIAKKLAKDIKSKISNSKYKIYIIGADEKTHEIEPIPISRLHHDRLRNIEQKIKETVRVKVLHLIPIRFKDGKNGLLIVIVGNELEK